ncbi:hypothetical protein G4B88_005549 [Cannabis sativa]|uniref:Uncharacterized protein n=1 Tax=Cannabis sativa TaxID=3483 RepID=A0A7J6DPZ5_CANSA|nr:hypothetical protein G4B88_005549 [Cannabis sativa]
MVSLPRTIAGPASVPLPPKQDTLISPNYQLALPRRQSAQVAEETKEDDEAIDPAAVTTTLFQQEQKTTDVPQQSQRVSFPLKRTK